MRCGLATPTTTLFIGCGPGWGRGLFIAVEEQRRPKKSGVEHLPDVVF